MSGRNSIKWPGRPEGHAVHIWRIEHSPAIPPGEFADILSAAEHSRAERLDPAFRDRYRTQRIVMRMLLGRYLGVPPEAIMFASEGNGKPCLAGTHAGQIHFNLSDTGGAFIIGFSAGGPIGIDMELRDRRIATDSLIRRICTADERALIDALPSEKRRSTVLRLWVRKEAVLKGLGHGIKVPMRLANVGGVSPVNVLFSPEMPGVDPADRWYAVDIDAGEEFMVTLAVPWLPGETVVMHTTAADLIARAQNRHDR